MWNVITDEASAESRLWEASLRPEEERELLPVFSPLGNPRFALGLETIYEGYLVHYGSPRLFAAPDDDTALLLGDYLYAHGLLRIASAGDVAALLGLGEVPGLSWGVAWQSAGRTADPWIGPDLLVEIGRVAAEGATSVVVCPVGFVSDHLEVLYDLDIEAATVARSLGVAFARTPSLNDDPVFLSLLADVVRTASRPGAGSPPSPTGVPSSAWPTASA